MGCIEIGLFIFGAITLFKRKVSMNKVTGVVGAPAVLIGLVLMAIFPVCVALGFVMVMIDPPVNNDPMEMLKYIWIDIVVTAVAVIAAVVIYNVSPKVNLQNPGANPQSGKFAHPYGKPGAPPPQQPPHQPPTNNPYDPPRNPFKDN